MFGLQENITCELPQDFYTLRGYKKGQARWCPGCGDHSVLSAIQRFLRDRQLAPENTVFVSGIGCSGRFPHYINTYGFHGLHGRAFPVACGVKFRRPDLDVFVITGDGDCCSIGAGHWLHAIRYNMNMTVLLFDNQIYSMTKKQTSPTSRMGTLSNTHPTGSVLPPVNPVQTTLGVSNVSFVAQTADWAPAHLYATIAAAYDHPGFSFVKIIMRCPHFLGVEAKAKAKDREHVIMLEHENGIQLDEKGARFFNHRHPHDPRDLHAARALAKDMDNSYLGLFYHDPDAPRYDLYGAETLGFTPEQKLAAIDEQLDGFSI